MQRLILAALGGVFLGTAAMAGPVEQPIAIEFALVAGGLPLDCATPARPLGEAQTLVNLRDARFFIHDLTLITAAGSKVPVQLTQNEWQYLNLALVDLEDGSGHCGGNRASHAVVSGLAPAGDYQGVQFTVGVPVQGESEGRVLSLNHSSTEQVPPPLDIQAMAWNWQAGRKFMKIEVAPQGGVQRKNDVVKVWTVHLGSTGCVGNPATGEIVQCSSPNRFSVRLPNFDPRHQRVVLDLAELFAGSDLGRDEGGAAGCMSSPQDPECPAIFRQLGLQLQGTGPGPVAAGQPLPDFVPRVFRVEARQP